MGLTGLGWCGAQSLAEDEREGAGLVGIQGGLVGVFGVGQDVVVLVCKAFWQVVVLLGVCVVRAVEEEEPGVGGGVFRYLVEGVGGECGVGEEVDAGVRGAETGVVVSVEMDVTGVVEEGEVVFVSGVEEFFYCFGDVSSAAVFHGLHVLWREHAGCGVGEGVFQESEIV